MFRSTLVTTNTEINCCFLRNAWAKPIPGLVRVPFSSATENDYFYVVYYSEVKQKYFLSKILRKDGTTIWSTSAVNGGYGTPIALDDIVVVHSEFDGLVAFDALNGQYKWSLHTHKRTRCSFTTNGNEIVFSSGDDIFFITKDGKITKKINIEGHFLFGNLTFYNDVLITLSTYYNSIYNESRLEIVLVDYKDENYRTIDLVTSPVISSDTSGCFLSGNYLYVTASNYIFCFNLTDFSQQWATNVSGFCGRHMPIADGEFIYFTTIDGKYGSLSRNNGEIVWLNNTKEGMIMNPPSIIGNSLLIMADGKILIVDKFEGYILQDLPVGHAPYSACVSLDTKTVLVGGGEPPLNGMLFCFSVESFFPYGNNIIHYEAGNSETSTMMHLIMYPKPEWINIAINARDISESTIINGERINEFFHFNIPLKNNNIRGSYLIPVIISDVIGNIHYESISIFIEKDRNIPAKKIIEEYNHMIEEEDPFYSGAAIAKEIYMHHGKTIEQSAFREIISYVKDNSKWHDADFQTWRLIMNRVLCSPANNLVDFIKSEK